MKKQIDAKGLACPRPVILTKKELDSMTTGEVKTLVDNQVAVENLSRMATSLKLGYETEVLGENSFAVTIKKGETADMEAAVAATVNTPTGKGTVIVIQSDQMGRGEEALGKLLMKSFIYTVKETTPHPEAILFYNSGVRLTVEDSPVIDDLKHLENLGVEIISCGTCLDFYELKEKLKVGIISNMYTIYEKMSSANNTITIG